jgi:phage terminase large subunit-like protein
MRAVGECEIVHDGNPVLAWCLGNAVARQNEREELAPDKKRSHEKIDLACCAIMAYSGVMLGFDEQLPGPADYYESNPVEFV